MHPAFRVTTLSLLLCGVLSVRALAQEPVRSLSQLYHTAWTTRDGAPSDVNALAQTPDGYLWLGGSDGLFRFDGVRFVLYQPGHADAKAIVNIYRLLATRDGRLWVGFGAGGVSVIDRDSVRNFTDKDSLARGSVFALAQDSAGAVWAGTVQGLAKFEGGRWQRIGPELGFVNAEGKAVAEVWSILTDRRGQLWVAAGAGIFRRTREGSRFELIERKPRLASGGWNEFLVEAPDGTIWASDRRGLRIVDPVSRKSGSSLLAREVSDGGGTAFDHTGAIWVGLRDGLQRIVPGLQPMFPQRERMNREGGLSGGEVRGVLEDREGNIWVGTSAGLDRFRRSKLTHIELPLGTRGPFAIAAGDSGSVWIGSWSHPAMHLGAKREMFPAVQARPDVAFRDAVGAIWFGGDSGLWQSTRSGFARVSLPDVHHITVQAVARDDSGSLWLSLSRPDSALYRMEAGRWILKGGQGGVPHGPPIVMTSDDSGRVWLGYYMAQTRVVVWNHGVARTFDAKSGLDLGGVFAIHQRGQHIWIGGERGLALLRGDLFTAVRSRDGPAFRMITGIVEAQNGDLWLHSAAGITRVPAVEVQRAIADTAHKVSVEWFDYRDGLDGAPSVGPLPTMIKTSDGRLWFATNLDLASLDPNSIPRNTSPPPVVIERLTSGERSFPIAKDLTLPVHTRSLRIEYTALSLSVPERVRFRYQLIGSDEGWQETGGRREANYTNLHPGSYHFRVVAANEDGVWNETGATLDFIIPPSFTQSHWFVAIWVLALSALVWIAYRLRMRQLAAGLRMRYEAALSERTRIAQELHDTLLQGFTGITMQLRAIQRIINRQPEEGAAALEKALTTADTTLRDARNTIWDMRAVELHGRELPEALEGAVRSVMAGTPIALDFTVQGQRRPLTTEVETTALRVGREAVLNVLKHADARRVEVQLEYSSRSLTLQIRDDGRGISIGSAEAAAMDGHLGISGMRTRAHRVGGTMDIASGPGGGTTVRLSLPVA